MWSSLTKKDKKGKKGKNAVEEPVKVSVRIVSPLCQQLLLGAFSVSSAGNKEYKSDFLYRSKRRRKNRNLKPRRKMMPSVGGLSRRKARRRAKL
jgi:hypothetical protein